MFGVRAAAASTTRPATDVDTAAAARVRRRRVVAQAVGVVDEAVWDMRGGGRGTEWARRAAVLEAGERAGKGDD